MKTAKVNMQAAFEAVCYGLFGTLILYMVISKKYLAYITPRMAPYLCFAAILSYIWAIAGVRQIRYFRYRKYYMRYLVLIIPMVLLLSSPGRMVGVSESGSRDMLVGAGASSSSAAQTYGDSNSDGSGALEKGEEDTSEDDEAASYADEGIYETTDGYGGQLLLHGYDKDNKTINIEDEEFIKWLNVIFSDVDTYCGWTITVTGSVFKDESLEENEFVIARLVMTCCIADLVPCGIVCKGDGSAQYESDQWLTITGTIFKGSYQGNTEPQIEITSVKEAEPIDGYLYPY